MSDVHTQPLVDQKGRIWQERTVVVKRDKEGFGFTLSKEMPVFVDNVSHGSSADRAGILSGDRIIKVNGVSVMGHKHNEVVDMIRISSHVTLTVISKLNDGTKAPKDPSQVEISPPQQYKELTLQSLKTMLQRQRKVYESLCVDYSKAASEKLEKELKDCESIIKILEFEISSKSPAIEAHIHTTSASIQALTGKTPRSYPSIADHTLTKRMLAAETETRKTNVSPTKFKLESPKPSRSHTFSNGTLSGRLRKNVLGFINHPVHVDASDGSDEDLSDEVVDASEAGPFSSIQELRNNPAHMAVFLHYLYSNKDPKYLLFYVVASSYQTQCKTADVLKQRGMDIYWTFLLDNAPLHIEVEESMKVRLLKTLETEDNENKLRSVFVEVRESLSEVIVNELANYRHKRVMGLAGIFGDHLLSSQMSISKQIEVVHAILLPDLKQCLDEKNSSNSSECTRNQAIAACIATLIVDVTGKTRERSTPSVVDKVQTFIQGDVRMKKGKSRKKTTSLSRNGHSLQLSSYSKPTTCDFCGKLLWGVIHHGYQCTVCDFNVHRYFCINVTSELCPGKKKRKPPPTPKKPSLTTYVLPEEPELGIGLDDTIMEEDEEEGLSPPPAPGDGEPHAHVEIKRDRSISEPRHNMLISCNSVAVEQLSPEHPDVKDNIVTRTQSERLQTKPDHLPVKRPNVEQQLSSISTMSSSDDSLIGGKLIMDEDLREFLDEEVEEKPKEWALTADKEVLQGMKQYEIRRQENIQELVYTERSHLHRLKIMKHMYKDPLVKHNILSVKEAEQLFPSLEELILFHSGLSADLKERVMLSQNNVVKNIADVLLQRFDGAAGERLCHASSVFASNQAKADRLFKDWKRRNERFRTFVKNTEAHPHCQKLTLKELIPIAWQRLTKYQLLTYDILGSFKKHWEELDDADQEECQKMETALSCVKAILQYVNVRAENRRQLLEFQDKLDTSALEKANHPIAQLFKNLDLTAEGQWLIHQGPLTWRIQHRRFVELYVLLLTDILVLMEKHEDKYVLRCHTLEKVNGVKEELSPVIRLKECLLRSAAADKGGRTFLLVNTSSLMKLAQMYEFSAEGPQEKKQWEEAIQRTMMGAPPGGWSSSVVARDHLPTDLPTSPLPEDYTGRTPLGLSALTFHLNPREQLDKIDDDMKKLLNDKLNIVRAMQGGIGGERIHELTPVHKTTKSVVSETPKDVISASIDQAGEIIATLSHIMVPNPTKSTIAETQTRLTDTVAEIQRNLSKLLLMIEQPTSAGRLGQINDTLQKLYLGDNPIRDKGATAFAEMLLKNNVALDTSTDELVGGKDDSTFSSDYTQEAEQTELGDRGGEMKRESSTGDADSEAHVPSQLPAEDTSPASTAEQQEEAVVLPSPHSSCESPGSMEEDKQEPGGGFIVAPPEPFSGDDSKTPTPQNQMEAESTTTSADSDSETPRTSPCEQPTSAPSPPATPPPPAPDVVETPVEVISFSSPEEKSPNRLSPLPSLQNSEDKQKDNAVKVLKVISSSEHNYEPSSQQEQQLLEENVPSYSLSRSRPDSTASEDSQDIRRSEGDVQSESSEGTDL